MAEFTPINTQEEFDKAIAGRLARLKNQFENELENTKNQYADYEQLKSEITALKEQNGELAKNFEEANNRVAQYERESVKTRIARENGLSDEFSSYLKGNTEEELNESAKFLAEHMQKKKHLPPANKENNAEDNPYKQMLRNMKGDK